MRELASGHLRLVSSFNLGSSIVMASCERGAFEECEGAELCGGVSEWRALEKNGAQEVMETVLKAEERNLRRFMVITSVERIEPTAGAGEDRRNR